MSNGLHRDAAGQLNMHVIHAFEFADQTEREAGTGYTLTPDDVHKIALQLDDFSYWVLTDDSPITWVAIGADVADTTPADGWIESSDTWTYASADDPTFTFTIAGVDRSAILTPGTRIKLTQTTAKYFIVTKVAFSTDTTVTIYGGTDYDLANAAITLPFYSRVKAPQGFPLEVSKWTLSLSDTSNRSQASPVDGTWYNLGSLSIDIHIGCWRVQYQVCGSADATSDTFIGMRTTLSTANNSESDSSMTYFLGIGGPSGAIQFFQACSRERTLVLAAKTTHYLNSNGNSSPAHIEFRGDLSPTRIDAICAYL